MSAPVVLSKRHSVVLTRTWIAILLLVAVDAIWMHKTGIALSRHTILLISVAMSFLAALTLFYQTWRCDDAIVLAAQVMNQMILGSCALATFSYLALLPQAPLMDARFAAFDEAIGFDWVAYIGWVERHPAIARIFSLSYAATGPEILVMLALLAFLKRFTEFHRFALGYLFAGAVTVAVSGVWPALTAYIYRHTDPAAYPHLHIAQAIAYKEQFLAMRNHTMTTLPENFQGIVAFPSFHSALAILVMAGALAIPLRVLRWSIIFINLLMLLSTPVDGGHYLVDTLAGIALGLLAVVCTRRWVKD